MASSSSRVGPPTSPTAVYQPDSDDEDQKDAGGPVQQAAQRQLSLRRATVEAPHFFPRSMFPISDFQKAIRDLDYDAVFRILEPRGWTAGDLDRTKMIMGIKKREKERFGAQFEALNLEAFSNRDEVVFPLLLTGIEKGDFSFLPALPPFSRLACNLYSVQFAKAVEDRLRGSPTDENLTLFLAIVRRYPLPDMTEWLKGIYEDLAAYPDLQAKLKRAFPAHIQDAAL